MCNKMWAYAPFLELAINNKELTVLCDFHQYLDSFPNLLNNPNIFIIHRRHKIILILLTIVEKILRLIPHSLLGKLKIHFDTYRTDGIKIIHGWGKSHCIPVLNHALLSSLFAIESKSSRVRKLFETKRTNHSLIVGIHLRKQDYRKWRNGKYFYSDEFWHHTIQQIRTGFKDSNEPLFFLASDEPIDLLKFNGLNVFSIDKPSPVEDLFGLSCCDYIIGPPSTFSMWASFLQRRPIHFIVDPKGKITFDSFSRIVAQDVFENGKILKLPNAE